MARILYLIDSLSSGGAERQLSLLLKYLPPAWETRVVSLGGGPYHQVLLDQKIAVHVCQRHSRFDFKPVLQLYAEILLYRPHIIHSWAGLSSALAAPLCKLLRILFIDGSIRIANPASRHSWRRRITFALSDHVVSNSHAGILAYRIRASKSSVIYNAIDPDRLKPIGQNAHKPNELTTVVMAARISPFKDFPSFFEAARRLNVQEPGKWKFVAIGAGGANDRTGLRMLAGDLVRAGVVELPDAGLEVLPYVQGADIGVLLSASAFKEGISNSIMEYMACGLPVVCSDSGGNRELVADGETGFVIPSENVAALVEKLRFLKARPEIAHRMGRAGHERLMSLCAIDRMISDYGALYNKLLLKHNGKSDQKGHFKERNEDGALEG